MLALVLVACAPAGSPPEPAGSATGPAGTVTVDNCGAPATFPSPARRMFVNDSNLTALSLAVGAADQIAAVTSLEDDVDVLTRKYGDVVSRLPLVSAEYPTMENVVAARADVVVAGWNYGYSDSTNLTPQTLAERGVAGYVLSESCRRPDGTRGTMDPWEAVRADLRNIGAITGHPGTAADVVADTDRRLDALRAAPQPAEKPVVFVFDSGTDAIFSSGAFGGPQAVIEAAGGTNALADVEDTWTEVPWERLATARPDYIVFVDYPGQTVAEKERVLATHPASRDLPAVREKRYLSLPYALWTSGPLNIDAAEHLRHGLEQAGLVPPSAVRPALDLG
ncbi:ABC transporter substrate-binding protein [Microlunatus capsulatus]|uniref:ABC transporter substrate-binding protein n=1 Tax=Microlunatus capsulatus TaxID=99117 RepID=UPI003558D1FD